MSNDYPGIKPEDEVCAWCKFFRPDPKTANRGGVCAERSPQALIQRYLMMSGPKGEQILEGVVNGYFPPTSYRISCGAFKRRATNGAAEPKGFTFEAPVVGETMAVEPPLPGEMPLSKEEKPS